MSEDNSKNKIWLVGPCSMEDKNLFIDTAKKLAPIMEGKNWYYKGSFDKANRSSVEGNRGPGLEKAIEIFKEIKKEISGIKLITDVHETHQVEKLAPHIDCIQIPAFLCRQTDLLVECGKHFDFVNIKKGQWMNPNNIVHSAGKVKSQNKNAEVWITERGTFFGYDKLTVDFGIVDLFHQHFDRVIFDCTHSTQFIKDGFTIGSRKLAEQFFLSSSIFGYSGIFAETHPNPKDAVSDGMCMIYLDRMKELVDIHDAIENTCKDNKKFLEKPQD